MTADTVGGVWTYAVELMRALPNVEFILATMGRMPNAGQRDELAPLANVQLMPSDFKLEWMDEPWDDVARAGEWLLAIERDERPAVVHLNGDAHGALPFRAPKIVVGHSCVLSWWRAVHGVEAPPSWSRYADEVGSGLRGADLVVAPSAWMLGALHDLYRFDRPTKLIYNGRTFTPSRGFEHRARVFAAGRLWDEAKNLRAVVDAAPQIDWPVRLAGDGGTSSDNVTHLGHLDADGIARAYGESAIYLFPALYEPFGLSILEAALAGCALVIGDIPSLREIWRDAAVFVPPRDPAVIARTVNEVIANDAFRLEIAQRAQQRATEFTPRRMAHAYSEAYHTLAPHFAHAEARA
jgi:glycosyltransferase involved in cell wall biosynthesis